MKKKKILEAHRPDPDALLTAVQKEESRQNRGKLKIFFGMAAGVGKTYAMLDAARAKRADGIDVVAGMVETHGRVETEAMLESLEIIPRRAIDYRGTTLYEMDIDAILARNPDLVLVDELAHTNAPGSRHAKRYQDVTEIIEHGIDVYTTVNVQHFQSRADAVAQITGIIVQETVPDTLLDLADEIELIDISPEDLRRRLSEGKVYTSERSELAARNFFRTGNLTALREMALRLTAEHVDHQLQDYMQLKRIAGPWKSGERLMVAVGPSPFSERLIRWTRRMAYNLEASWLAITVETSEQLSPEASDRLARNLALARELGGEIVTATGHDVYDALLRVARQRNVTQLVIGKPQHNRLQSLLRGGSLVDKVVRNSGDIDVYVVNGDEPEGDKPRRALILPTPRRHSTPRDYAMGLLIVAGVTLLDLIIFTIFPMVGYQIVGFTGLLSVLLAAVFIGRGPAVLAGAVSALLWNYLFIEPRYTLGITEVQDIVLVVLYFLTALIAGSLTARIRAQEFEARRAAEQSTALYTLAHQTATAVDMDSVLKTAVDQIGTVFDAKVAILLANGEELSEKSHPSSTLQIDDKEHSVALWVYEHGKPAGRFTDTLMAAVAQYRPLLTPSRTVGAIGIQTNKDARMSFEQEVLLETFINQISVVIEREMLDEDAEQAAMLRESERLYATLLNSISHELRTPIAAIMGASNSLKDTPSDTAIQKELSDDIYDAANRLNRLVENLLDMSRLESGRLVIKRDWCDIGDVIGVVVKRLEGCSQTHPLTAATVPDLPLVQLDFVLLEQALVNIVDNACSYTPPGTPIHIEAHADAGKAIVITITDRGAGIPQESLSRIFDKFYRAPGTAAGGTGLGLSITRGLIEAHNGTIEVENAPEGGARFTIRLPLNGTPPPVKESEYVEQ